MTEAEIEIMDHLAAAYRGIQKLGLNYNESELASHMHGMQSFVTQRVLQRLEPECYSNWYKEDGYEKVSSN